jgi:hypothetical protein
MRDGFAVDRWVLLLLLAGCASQAEGPYFHDEQFLVLGVDPDAEARAEIRQLEKKGFFVARRVRGQNFSALGFSDARDVAQKVRVITRRGIALALDPQLPTPLSQGVRYELIDGPVTGTQDADGDGFEELFVLVRHEAPADACIAAYRARDSGFVDAIDGADLTLSIDSTQVVWHAPAFCASAAPPSDAAPSTNAPGDTPPNAGEPPATTPASAPPAK